MIHALFVTRDSNRHQVIDGLLEGDGREAITIHQVADLAAAAEASSAGGVDVVLYEVSAQPSTDIEALTSAMSDVTLEAPVLVLMDHADKEQERLVAEAGAVDALPWDALTPALLQRAIRYSVDKRNTERQLADLVLIDSETGLARPPLFWEILSLAVKRAKRNQDYLAVLTVKLIGLATMGNPGAAARESAMRLAGLLRASDTVARFDIDQLSVLVESMPRVEDIQTVAEKIVARLSEPQPDGGGTLSSAVGIALYPTVSSTAEALIGDATVAMHLAIEQGGDTFKFA